MNSSAVECRKLLKRYGGITAVSEVDLTVESNSTLAIVGPSGCGKTTLLRLIAGFEHPDGGTIDVGSRRVVGPGLWLPPESRRLGMVFQDYALFPHLNVERNIAYGLSRGGLKRFLRHAARSIGMPPAGRRRAGDRSRRGGGEAKEHSDENGLSLPASRGRIAEMLDLVGLSGLGNRLPHELSGGEQQRVALARALAPQPEVLLLDEPFSNLDATRRGRIRAEVKEILGRAGTTAIFVTHDQDEAFFLGDRVAVMNAGRIEQAGTPEAVFHQPATPFVARFLGIADFLTGRVEGSCIRTPLGDLPAPENLAEASTVDVMVRPDDLMITPSDPAASDRSAVRRGRGVIAARSFQGTHYLYRVELEAGLSLRVLAHHTAQYEVGLPVDLRIDAGHDLVTFAHHGGEGLERPPAGC